jgi:heptosyltransferase-1
MRILIVKLSSLGDVVQALPVINDIRRHVTLDLHIDWVVEEDYAPLLALHPGIDRVISVGLRRWRKQGLLNLWRNGNVRAERIALRQALALTPYDAIIDLQGLIKSAWVAQMAQGPRHGWASKAAREGLASLSYQHRYQALPYDAMPAVHRYRELVADVLGYRSKLGDTALDYGLKAKHLNDQRSGTYIDSEREACQSILLLHGTAREEKLWPEPNWIALAQKLIGCGYAIELSWGNAKEQARAMRFAEAIDAPLNRLKVDQQVLSLDQWPQRLSRLKAVVGVDSGLLFLALACAVPALGIYLATDPGHVGLIGASAHRNLGGKSAAVSVEEVLEGLEAMGVMADAA